MVHDEVVAIGWNGFPAKAHYGEFPRASDTEEAREKKEPYVIHAEQNALLTRNKKNMNDVSSVLFVNEVPCNECVPLLIKVGVQNIVIPKLEGPEIGEDQISGQRAFKVAFDAGKFECFGSKRSPVCRNLNL
jgi:deoxycytidylate deaminase